MGLVVTRVLVVLGVLEVLRAVKVPRVFDLSNPSDPKATVDADIWSGLPRG